LPKSRENQPNKSVILTFLVGGFIIKRERGVSDMKCTVIITDERDEVVVYAREYTDTVAKIKALAEGEIKHLIGIDERGESFVIVPHEVTAFTVEDGCVWAILDTGRLKMRERLYELEGALPKSFVKINKSSIASLDKIRSFSTGFGCSLDVTFKNGYKDYVSRRQIKILKERLTQK
jgi:DNA-binding LytR/AlgR family response regulator